MSKLEQTLNDSLKQALERLDGGKDYNANVMVTGNPFSDNQSFIEDWAKRNNIEVIRADSIILNSGEMHEEKNGILVKSKDKLPSLMPLMSDVLSKPWFSKDKKYIVLFHMYNWQSIPNYRDSLYPFVVERKIIPDGKFNGEYVKVPNVLFCVASVLQRNYDEEFALTKLEAKAYPIKIDYSHYEMFPFRLLNENSGEITECDKEGLDEIVSFEYKNDLHKVVALYLLGDMEGADKALEQLEADDKNFFKQIMLEYDKKRKQI